MADVFDVAKYILLKNGTMTTAKLQKLVYYSQAWSLVWDEKPLFNDRIEAWANGPVVPSLFSYHKGMFYVDAEQMQKGDIRNLTRDQKDTIDAVLEHYSDKSAQWLIDLTHLEEPWKNARQGCVPGERCTREILLSDMMDYYSGL